MVTQVIATTYGKYWNDARKYSVVSVRFKISEIDALAAMPSINKQK